MSLKSRFFFTTTFNFYLCLSSVRDYMVKLWTNFAQTKQPTQAGQFDFEWSELNLEDPKYLVIDGEPVMDYNNDMIDGVRFWEGLFPLDPTIKGRHTY